MSRAFAPRALLPVLLSCCATLAACSREAEDWRAARAADTVAAYEQFVREHPASSRGTEAASRAAQLAESEDWRRAQEQDTLQAYQLFLSQHPTSRWAAEARTRIDTITLGSQAQQDPAAGTTLGGGIAPSPAVPVEPAPAPTRPAAPAPASPAANPPAAAPSAAAPATAAPPAAAAPTAGGWAAQLGAFSSSAAADGQWRTLAARQLAPLKGREHRIVAGTGGTGSRVYRLQVPARNEADARGLCSGLGTAGLSCVVVHP